MLHCLGAKCIQLDILNHAPSFLAMGWLRLSGSLNLQVSFEKAPYKRDYIGAKCVCFLEYSLFHRALFQKRPIRDLLQPEILIRLFSPARRAGCQWLLHTFAGTARGSFNCWGNCAPHASCVLGCQDLLSVTLLPPPLGIFCFSFLTFVGTAAACALHSSLVRCVAVW